MKYDSSTFKNAFDLVPVCILTLDENAAVNYINKTALSLLNKENGEAIDKRFGDSFNCINSYEKGCSNGFVCKKCEIRRAITLAYEDGKTTDSIELKKHLLIDGKEVEFWLNITIAPIIVDEKLNVVITLLDITEKKKEQLNLIKSRDYVYNLLNQTPAIIWKINANLECDYINKQWEDYAGEKVEKDLSSWIIKMLHIEDLDRCKKVLYESSSKRKSFQIEARLRRSDGEYRNCIIEGLPYYDLNGYYDGYIGSISDITELKIAEEKLRENEKFKEVLLSNLPGMVYRCNYDKEWTMQFISDGCYELTGYLPESLLNNRELSFNKLINEEYRDYLWDKWAQALATRRNLKEEYSITTATGETKWVFEQGHGIYDNNGQVVALEGLIIDISDRKKKEDEIQYLNHHDVLTGLYNRRFFDAEIKRLDKKTNYHFQLLLGI